MDQMPSEFDTKARDWDADPSKTERARLVADAMRATVPLRPMFAALEYGCGTGILSFHLLPFLGSIVLADSSKGMLEVLREKIAAADITNMHPVQLDLVNDQPLSEGFDIIYSLLALHHVTDTFKVLSAFRAMLKPSGFLCIADLDEEDGSFHGHGFTGPHGFDRESFGIQVEAAGFCDLKWQTVCEITRGVEVKKSYPVFLLIARAAPSPD